MRPIKFRAWSFERRTMLYDVQNAYDGLGRLKNSKGERVSYGECCFGSFLDNTYYDEQDDYKEKQAFEVMQFTGLKDKNGVEIYEGDVVRHPPTGYSARIESLVDFENGGFYPFADDWDNAPYPKAQECEVIGNIYENPELMK